MLLHKIIERFQGRVEDVNYWDSTRAKVLANDAVDDIVSKLDVKVQQYREWDTVTSRQTYDLPLDYIENESLYYNSGYNQVIVMEDSPMDIYGVVGDPLTEGSPTHGFIYAVSDRPELHFYPVPDAAYSMQWWYIGWAPELVNDNDETMIPRFLHKYIVDYMEMKAQVQDKEMSLVQFRGLWKDDLMEMRRAVAKRKLYKRDDQFASGKKLFPTIKSTYREEAIRLTNSGGYIWE